MIELVFASQNRHKRDEIAAILKGGIKITTLDEIYYSKELEESHNTLKENALQKSRFVFSLFKRDCFSEDTGLEVEALLGEPGVKSARFSGENKNAQENTELLLLKMRGIENRAAQFRTVIALIFDGKEYFFEGICKGKIALKASGSGGFGYDPVFIPDGYGQTFAEMPFSIKNQISHRSRAIGQLKNFFADYTLAKA